MKLFVFETFLSQRLQDEAALSMQLVFRPFWRVALPLFCPVWSTIAHVVDGSHFSFKFQAVGSSLYHRYVTLLGHFSPPHMCPPTFHQLCSHWHLCSFPPFRLFPHLVLTAHFAQWFSVLFVQSCLQCQTCFLSPPVWCSSLWGRHLQQWGYSHLKCWHQQLFHLQILLQNSINHLCYYHCNMGSSWILLGMLSTSSGRTSSISHPTRHGFCSSGMQLFWITSSRNAR